MENDIKKAWDDAEDDAIHSHAWALTYAWRLFWALSFLGLIWKFFDIELSDD